MAKITIKTAKRATTVKRSEVRNAITGTFKSATRAERFTLPKAGKTQVKSAKRA